MESLGFSVHGRSPPNVCACLCRKCLGPQQIPVIERAVTGLHDRMVETVVEQLGGLHIAVNNAGINKNAAAEDTSEADWDATFGVNTKGLFLCCQARGTC